MWFGIGEQFWDRWGLSGLAFGTIEKYLYSLKSFKEVLTENSYCMFLDLLNTSYLT